MAHEVLHALLHWADVTGLNSVADEESLCWEMGSLTRQFRQRYYEWQI